MTTINHIIQSGSGWEQLPTLQSRTFQNITSGVDSIRVKIQDDIPAFDDKGIEIPYGEKLTLDSLLVGVWVLRKATFNIVVVETPTIDGGLSPEDQEKLAGALQISGANTMLSTYEASVDNPDGVVSAKTISGVSAFGLLEKYDYTGNEYDRLFTQGGMNSNYYIGGLFSTGTIGIHRATGAEKVVTTSLDPVTSFGGWDILYDAKTDVTLISGHDYIGLFDSNLDEIVTMKINIASGGTVDYNYDGHNSLRLLSLTDSFVVVVMDSDNCIIVFDRADGSVVKVINDTWTNPPSIVATDNVIITSLEDHSGFRMMDIDGTNQATTTLDEPIQDFGYKFHVDEENNRFFGIGRDAPIQVFALDTGIKETEIAIPHLFNNNNFGMSFAYNSKTIVFGDHGYGSQDEGAFSLFNRETLALELVHAEPYMGYGRSVGIDENVVMIGNPGVNDYRGGYITYKLPTATLLDAEYHKERESYVDAELNNLQAVNQDTQEPNGFLGLYPSTRGVIELSPDGTTIHRVDAEGVHTTNLAGHPRYDANITTFYDGSTPQAREFCISPLNVADGGDDTLSVYAFSKKYILTESQKIILPDQTGLQFVYFQHDGTIASDIVLDKSYFHDKPIVSVTYGNQPDGDLVLFGDERHAITMDGETHNYLHFERGCAYLSGMDTVGLADGVTDITHITAGTAKDEDLPQNPPLQVDLPFWHLGYNATEEKNGWKIEPPSTQIAHTIEATAQYNLLNAGEYSLAPITGNDVAHMFIFYGNDAVYPYVKILGQEVFADAKDARLAIPNALKSLVLTNLPVPEKIAIAVYAINATGELVLLDDGATHHDLRSLQVTGSNTVINAAQHNDLEGRDVPDAHPIESITGGAGLGIKQVWTNIQTALLYSNTGLEIDFSVSQVINVDGTGLSDPITAINLTENQIGSIRFTNLSLVSAIGANFVGTRLPEYKDELQVVGYEVVDIGGTLTVVMGDL